MERGQPYLFSAPTENSPGARDLSRRNDGKADPRWEISTPRRQPIFLRTKVRAPFARPANTLSTYRSPDRQELASRARRVEPGLNTYGVQRSGGVVQMRTRPEDAEDGRTPFGCGFAANY